MHGYVKYLYKNRVGTSYLNMYLLIPFQCKISRDNTMWWISKTILDFWSICQVLPWYPGLVLVSLFSVGKATRVISRDIRGSTVLSRDIYHIVLSRDIPTNFVSSRDIPGYPYQFCFIPGYPGISLPILFHPEISWDIPRYPMFWSLN